jgi:hypothetical protein
VSWESTDLVLTEWKRYGHDRVYVATSAGVKLGYLDRKSGALVLDDESWRPAVERALDGSPQTLDVAPPPSTGSAPTAVEPVWRDLAANRPGQSVRAEAESLLEDMRERSKLRAFVARAVDAKTDERAFRVGADGEEAVGPRLERLVKRGWHVLHSIPVGDRGSDIDHLLVGPGGVYTVNTKNHPGKKIWVGEHAILVDGQKTSYLRNSRYEAERVRKALHRELGEEIPVRPVLVVLTGTLLPQVTIKKMPADVLVLDRMDVPGAFKRAANRLSSTTIDRVYEVARRSTTWA